MNQRMKVYLTDRDDDGKLFGKLLAVVEDDDILYDVELAPHLTVLSNDGLTRIAGTATHPDYDVALPEIEEWVNRSGTW